MGGKDGNKGDKGERAAPYTQPSAGGGDQPSASSDAMLAAQIRLWWDDVVVPPPMGGKDGKGGGKGDKGDTGDRQTSQADPEGDTVYTLEDITWREKMMHEFEDGYGDTLHRVGLAQGQRQHDPFEEDSIKRMRATKEVEDDLSGHAPCYITECDRMGQYHDGCAWGRCCEPCGQSVPCEHTNNCEERHSSSQFRREPRR